MGLEDTVLSEVYQTQRQMPYYFTYMYNINKQRKQIQTHRYREQTDGCQMGRVLGRMVEKGEGIKQYKLVITKQLQGELRAQIQNHMYEWVNHFQQRSQKHTIEKRKPPQ